MRKTLVAGIVSLLAAGLLAEGSPEKLAWWTQSRFGMFIHFGLYATPARGEWVKQTETIAEQDYRRHFEEFNPDLYDPATWAKIAKAAGMKYVVLTAKHHEGFCLWDSKYTDYKVTNTPYGKDLIRAYVDAFRAEGLRVGLYYSLIDWHHPQFTADINHPRHPKDDEGWNDPKAYVALNKNRDMSVYRQYMKDQVRELLTNYGRIDIMWFDFSYAWRGALGKGADDWDSKGLLEMARGLQPWLIVDDRLGLNDTDWGWDFKTPEQFKVASWPKVRGRRVPWETCQTFSGHWGYARDEYTWKSSVQLLELLASTVSKGGNLILNVGPTARGEIDGRAQDRLAAIGRWMRVNSRAIYGCTQAPDGFKAPEYTLLTYNPETRRLYVHLVFYPMGSLPCPFGDKVLRARFLHDGSEVKIKPLNKHFTAGYPDAPKYNFIVPVVKPDVEMPVIEVDLREEPAEFSVVTYNVRHGAGNDDKVDLARQAALVNAEKPRFVLLQELDQYNERSGFLDEQTAYGELTGMYSVFGRTLGRESRESYGIGLLSREPPVREERIRIPDSREDRMILICEFPDCYVGSTHFSVASEEDRKRALELLRKRLADGFDKPFILGGDFNADPDSEIVAELKKDFEILTPVGEPTYIGKSEKPLTDRNRSIDYIMVDKAHAAAFKVVRAAVLGENAADAPSDHRPLVVTLKRQ